MQNKGAIKIFAILLALACIFYLSFTWVTRGVETEAKEYAETLSSSAGVQTTAKKYANGDATKERFYVDSLKEKLNFPNLKVEEIQKYHFIMILKS